MHDFDADAARVARDEAVHRVDEHAEEDWKAAALDAVRFIAEKRDVFTTDAVWWLLGQQDVEPPHEERALGAVMQAAARQGWIAPTDRTRKSIRPACHARDLRIWRSLLREAAHA
jgi:hypothetical protein